MSRIILVIVALFGATNCSLIFETESDYLPGVPLPALRYDFQGDGVQALRSTGSLHLDLRLTGAAVVDESGLNLLAADSGDQAAAISYEPASEFSDACKASEEMSFSMWISPGSADPLGLLPSRIITLESSPTETTNFMLGQGVEEAGYNGLTLRVGGRSKEYRLEAQELDLSEGEPLWIGFSLTDTGQARLRIGPDIVVGTDLSMPMAPWSSSHSLALGDAPGSGRQWKGEVHHVELFCVALSDDQLDTLRDASAPL